MSISRMFLAQAVLKLLRPDAAGLLPPAEAGHAGGCWFPFLHASISAAASPPRRCRLQ